MFQGSAAHATHSTAMTHPRGPKRDHELVFGKVDDRGHTLHRGRPLVFLTAVALMRPVANAGSGWLGGHDANEACSARGSSSSDALLQLCCQKWCQERPK